MPRVTFVEPDGRTQELDLAHGSTLMRGAVQGDVHGIEAECGGCCSCATCHVYVDPDFLPLLPAMDDLEDELLSGAAAERRPESRLSCQITVGPELDGLVIRIPDRQF